MARLFTSLRDMLYAPAPPQPGIYHYRRELAGRALRLHLRIEPGGSGLLVVNASGILHLNATATFLMKLILDGKNKKRAISDIRRVYRARKKTIAADYDRILATVKEIESADDACPIWKLDVNNTPPFQNKITAPYRADLALNYQCNNDCVHCYVPRDRRQKKPLSSDQWKEVLRRLWDAGVPHICFTGGEATLYQHLVELIERAEDLGQVTGMLTNGRRLSDNNYMKSLCAAGLDHVQITLESHDESVHDKMVGANGAFKETVQGIRNAVENDIYLLTNTTVCQLNINDIERTIEFLASLGVRQFAVNSFILTGAAPASGQGLEEHELEELAGRIVHKAGETGLRFIWYTPTHYCQFNPAEYGIGLKRCTAAEYNVCIEPDGEVIPCQSYYESAGNILTVNWPDIWNSPVFTGIRNRTDTPDHCRPCPDFEICGGGCPLSKGDRFLCTDSTSET